MSQRVALPRYHALDVFRFLAARQAAGERCVLIVISAIAGASARAVGTPMVVTESGDYAGYVSNGCVDGDIAVHALDALEDGQVRSVRYGQGSPYMDIRLPCGGGLDVVISPDPDPKAVDAVISTLAARQSVAFNLEDGFGIAADGTISYRPPLKIIAAGRGENLLFFTRAAAAMGMDILALTPDADIKAECDPLTESRLLSFGQTPNLGADANTAIILLFHDHDYELPVLEAALQSPAFYIGAMGSRKTHEQRCIALKAAGYTAQDISRIRGPVGLVPSMRDAGKLAISVLAEILEAERKMNKL